MEGSFVPLLPYELMCLYGVKGTYVNVLMLANPHVILEYKVSHTNSNIQI